MEDKLETDETTFDSSERERESLEKYNRCLLAYNNIFDYWKAWR